MNTIQNKLLTPEPVLNSFIPKNDEQNRSYQILLEKIVSGDSLFLMGNTDEAAKSYNSGLSIANNLKLNWHAIIIHCRLGFMYYWIAKPIQSEKHYDKSRQLIEGAVDIKDTLAVIETFVLSTVKYKIDFNDFLKSKNLECLLSEDITHFSGNRQIKFLLLKAISDKSEQRYSLFSQDLGEAERLFNYNRTGSQFWRFLIRLQQAQYYIYLNDFSVALEYLKELAYQVDNSAEYYCFKYYVFFSLGDLQLLLQNFNQAKKELEKLNDYVDGIMHISFADYHSSLGYVYEKLKDFPNAKSSYRLAEQIYNINNIEDARLAKLYWFLASISQSMNKEEAELYYLNKAEQILQIYPDPFLEPFVIQKLGMYYYERKEFDLAIFTFNLRLYDLEKLLNDEEYFKSQYFKLFSSYYTFMLKKRAYAFFFISMSKDFDLITLKQSYQDLIDLQKLYIKIYHQLTYEQSKKASLLKIRSNYNDIINVGYELYKKTGNDSIAYELFGFAEKGKAHLLKSFLSDELARKLAGIPDNLIQLLKDYQKEIDSLQYNIDQRDLHNDQKSDIKIHHIVNKIDNYNKFLVQLEKDYPKYLEFKKEPQSISIDQIQSKLLPEQALLEYYFTFNAFYIFYIDKNIFKLFISPVTRNFPERVLTYRKTLAEMEYGDFSQNTIREFVRQSNDFYKLMIEPVENLIEGKRLIIIPDGELILVPFESLVKNEADVLNETNTFKDLDYLIKSNSISYLYSANQLLDDTKARSKKIRFAGFAPDYSKTSSFSEGDDSVKIEFRQLPGAIEEVQLIDKYFKGKAFIGNEVSKERFFRESTKNDIIHLAMHTLLDNAEPMNSQLVFSPEFDQEKQLHAYEVYSHELTARLIVLSACNTVTGEVVKGEGVFNIARAFFRAGVKNIIITQWAVADHSSVYLMDRFYYYLSEGNPTDIALQQAKIDFLMNGDPVKTQPFFWAPFVCYGNPICMPDRTHKWPIALGSMLAAVIILMILKLRLKLF